MQWLDLTHRQRQLHGSGCVSTISLSISTVIKTVHFVSCHTRQQQQHLDQCQLQILQLNKSKSPASNCPAIQLSNPDTYRETERQTHTHTLEHKLFNQLYNLGSVGSAFNCTNGLWRIMIMCVRAYLTDT